ncbi:MAG TPA: hypothetical protein VFN97_08695 [Actinospica sp.]|nr:hypothetical protein [Actinospica sp.]
MTQSAENPEAAPAAPLQPAGPEPVQFAAPVPEPSAEELAAAAEKKAKRRRVFAKSAALAVPALALVGLLIGTGIEANAFTTKDNAASTAAKAANVADGLVGQLRAAQSAADASILVDPGCVAAESKTTASLEDKFLTDSDRLLNAEKGTSYSAFMVAANAYVNDLQSLSTNLQQDAALSKRQVFKSAMGTVTGDLGVVISAMQTILAGNVASSTLDSLDAAANRMDGDSTAVDTLCGGDTLTGGSGSSSSGGSGSGTTSA